MIFGLDEDLLTAIAGLADAHDVSRIILFGSRARGDYHERSDIDLAVLGGDIDCFSVDLEEDAPTLLSFDVVNLDGTVQDELRQSIEREGRIIYEKV